MDEFKHVKQQIESSKVTLSNHIAMTYALFINDMQMEAESPFKGQNWGYTALTKIPYKKRTYLQSIGARTREMLKREFFTPHMWLNAQIGDTLDELFNSLIIRGTEPTPEYVSSYNDLLIKIKAHILTEISEKSRYGLYLKDAFDDSCKKLLGIFDSETKKLLGMAGDVYARMKNDEARDNFISSGVTEFMVRVKDGACDECERHRGKIYTADEIKDIQPPFHPNCRCKLVSADGQEEGYEDDVVEETGKDIITKRNQLLNSVQNDKLKNAINEIYRPGAATGDGGLADAVRHELGTGELVGGKSHITKAAERVTNLENIIKKQDLSSSDLDIAKELLDDLKNALGGK